MKKSIALLYLCLSSIIALYASSIVLPFSSFDYVSEENRSADYKDTGLDWVFYGDIIKSTFYAKEGDYNIAIDYTPGKGMYDDIELYIFIDKENIQPSYFSINRVYEYGPIREDEDGNQKRALTKITGEKQRETLRRKDNSGSSYFIVRLNEGMHEISIIGRRTNFTLHSISFIPSYTIPEYKRPDSGRNAELIHIEAENIYSSSSTTLTSQMDRRDSSPSPSDPYHMVLNIAGGSNWNSDGDVISWKFNVAEAGSYRVNIKYRQNFKKGFSVYRRVLIDSLCPFYDFDEISFSYTDKWLINNLDSCLVYLEKGEHTISIEVVSGPYSAVLSDLKRVIADLNAIYRRIIMVTGTTPDVNREYDLDREIPDLMDSFEVALDNLIDIEKELNVISEENISAYVPLSVLITQVKSFISEPETIPSRIGVYRGNISALSSWLYQMQEQPLDIDWIEILGENAVGGKAESSFFRNLSFSFLSLLNSFKKDSKKDSDITIWVFAGRDQMRIISELIEEQFTPMSGIKVNVNLVQTGIEQAILAGSGPDVVLFIGNNVPVTLAMRDALYPLSSFDDFNSFVDEYVNENSLIPYIYEGSVYGLPLTESFPMMFYRTDVFEELGIAVPSTWDEFLSLIPIIQRNNMDVGVPSSFTTFLTLLYQKGGKLYSDDFTSTELYSEESYSAFDLYTRLFCDYSLPLSYDFYNRFRSGEMPIAISDYTEYGCLAFAAPELQGLWKMTKVPGGDECVVASSGQGAIILKDTDNAEESWTFLKWFSSPLIQIEYGNRIESLLGPAGRYPSANDEVIKELPWLPDESESIINARRKLINIPQIPGSYYTQRNINSAFRNVVNNGRNAREMLELYASIIDREILRKRNEIGLGGAK